MTVRRAKQPAACWSRLASADRLVYYPGNPACRFALLACLDQRLAFLALLPYKVSAELVFNRF